MMFWVGGDKWKMRSRFGSRGSNSSTPRRRTAHYACGTERAQPGEVAAALHASWKARRGART